MIYVDIFFKEDTETANRYMKRCLTLWVIREMQMKPTVRYHFTPIPNVIILI